MGINSSYGYIAKPRHPLCGELIFVQAEWVGEMVTRLEQEIGLTIARALISNGAKVYITGRRLETLTSAVQNLANGPYEGMMVPCVTTLPGHRYSLGMTRSSLYMDVIDKESIRNAVKVVEAAEGVLHILVNK